jgi:pseudouridine synthase
MIRLQKYLAQAGVASRRHSEKLITGGHVKVNGKPATELGVKVDPDRDRVEVDGKPVRQEELVYLVLNKPKGYVTTVSDPQGRQTVMELLPQKMPAHVVPVGRLDFYTEGVLLFTNDGELSAALLAPRRHVEKTYHVKLNGPVPEKDLQRLRDGVRLDDGHKTLPAKVDVLDVTAEGGHTWLVISISEGRSRQIHRMAEAIGKRVIKLARVAFGGITYFGLKVGECRQLTHEEVRDLRTTAGLAAAADRELADVRLAMPKLEPRRSPAPRRATTEQRGEQETGNRQPATGNRQSRTPSFDSTGDASSPRPERFGRPRPGGKRFERDARPERGDQRFERGATPERGGQRFERGTSERGGQRFERAPRPGGPKPARGRFDQRSQRSSTTERDGGGARFDRGPGPRSERPERPERGPRPGGPRPGGPRPGGPRSGGPRPAGGGGGGGRFDRDRSKKRAGRRP